MEKTVERTWLVKNSIIKGSRGVLAIVSFFVAKAFKNHAPTITRVKA